MTTLTQENGGISAWYFLSAISQLALEVKTGRNYYGSTSVLKGIQQRGWAPAGRCTRRAKLEALANLLDGQPAGPVIDLARQTLAEALEKDGLDLVRVAND